MLFRRKPLATHNPLMIGTLRSNQVRVMAQTPEGTKATEPDFDPIGIGVEGLMKTELFGLPSTLAPEILEKIHKQYLLLGKENKTSEEDLELIRLGFELNNLGITRTHPNPYFEQFATAMAKRTPTPDINLSKADLEEQMRLANEILAELLEEEKTGEVL